jgi:hypothetical protein
LSTTKELLDRKVAAPVYKTEKTAEGIRHANHVAPFIRKSWQSFRRQAAVARGLRPWSFFYILNFTLLYSRQHDKIFRPKQQHAFREINPLLILSRMRFFFFQLREMFKYPLAACVFCPTLCTGGSVDTNCYLFVCGLFGEVSSNSDYTTSYELMARSTTMNMSG